MASSAENVKLNRVSSALEQLDERLRRMQEKLLPTDPYILNCPSDHRMDMRQAELWIRDTPFKRGEEHLQYVTFLARDKGDNLLRTIGAWDDGKGGMKSVLQDPKAGARSGAASPMSAQAPKKKISLMDYKNKSTREAGAKASASRPVSPRPMSSTNGREGAVAAIPQLPEVKVSREEALPPQKTLKRYEIACSAPRLPPIADLTTDLRKEPSNHILQKMRRPAQCPIHPREFVLHHHPQSLSLQKEHRKIDIR